MSLAGKNIIEDKLSSRDVSLGRERRIKDYTDVIHAYKL